MGNSASRASCFFTASRPDEDDLQSFPSGFDEGLGHSFCYIKPPPPASSPSASPAPSKSHGGDVPSECSRITSSRGGVLPKTSSDASFKTISGASVSANTSTPLSLTSWEQFNSFSGIPSDCNAAFESSASFCALPLQPLPKGMVPYSGSPLGPLDKDLSTSPHDRSLLSNSLERGFASGPLERGHLSGPMDFTDRSHFSAPITAFYHRRPSVAKMFKKVSRPVKNVIGKTVPKTSSGTLTRTRRSSSFNNERKEVKVSRDAFDKTKVQWAQGKAGEDRVHIVLSEAHGWLFVGIYDGFNGPDATDFLLSNLYPAIQDELQGLLWNQKGEFEQSIPNAVNLDRNTELELSCQAAADVGIRAKNGTLGDFQGSGKSRGVLSNWKDNGRNVAEPFGERLRQRVLESPEVDRQAGKENLEQFRKDGGASVLSARELPPTPHFNAKAQIFQCAPATDHADNRGRESSEGNDGLREDSFSTLEKVNRKSRSDTHVTKHKDDKCRRQLLSLLNLEREQIMVEETMKQRAAEKQSDNITDVNHAAVLEALARALEATESAFLEMADQVIQDNPELALMGSCVLVMLMKGEDVYVMNVGDSRAVLALKPMDPCMTEKSLNGWTMDRTQSDFQKNAGRDSELQSELERITEETRTELESLKALEHVIESSTLAALQLSSDHSTCVIEEVRRIQSEHPDDEKSVSKDRVKGNLKVTRAFGAGFLKHPKWNDALLEMFQINYVGSSPYLSCKPALYHHRLAPQDHFLVLSSDGLYQYLTNEEVVAHVEWFMKRNPDGDPAQYLIEELLFRAAKKAGMDFLQLLNIPQGDRRRYHDDVSVMVVSLEGRMWRSSV